MKGTAEIALIMSKEEAKELREAIRELDWDDLSPERSKVLTEVIEILNNLGVK